jgi:hypothetical protein
VKFKKTISIVLLLVLAIQLLPVRQVIRYFFIDNQLTEELAEAKSITKNMRQLDEDKLLHDFTIPATQFIVLHKEAFFHSADTLPALYAIEILTPPPNGYNI